MHAACMRARQHLPSRMGLALLLFMQFLLVRVLLLLLLVRRLR